MSKEATTIVLCGGPINYTNLPIGTNVSNAMIPVNGKPVIGWILDDLLAKGIHQVTVVLREQDTRLQSFLERALVGRLEIHLARLHQEGTIIQSLSAGLDVAPTDGLVRIVLGDTLIQDSFTGESDFIYVGNVDDSRRWCLAVTASDGKVVDYIDKHESERGSYLALAGYYHLRHGDCLCACVGQSIANGDRELSHVLRRYGTMFPIYTRLAQNWYDFGHIDHLVDARRKLLQPRFFNSLTINPILNTITKVSEHDEKLRDELDWYLSIPDDLRVLTPRIISHTRTNGHLQIVQEYYGYPTLAELYVYGDLHADTWRSILRYALRVHQEFRRYPGQIEREAIMEMYVDKTAHRLDALRKLDADWSGLVDRESICFNGKRLRNIGKLWNAVQRRAQELAQTAPVSVIHGDFCFSNTLFDVSNQIIRLIDPRGRFGCKGIYGDARYDIAKMRHSAHGFYDFILVDMFELRETPTGFEGQIFVNGTPTAVAALFDELLVDVGYDLSEIKFIEGLLFISMPPLHHGNLHRQQMMYLTGLALLNEVL